MNIHYKHTHHDKPHYECEKCNQVFAVKRELSTHQRTHSGEQPHKCKICKKEFGTRQLLKKHTMWHSGQRSHVCKYCAKAFYQVISIFYILAFKFSYRLIDTFQNIPLVPFATNYLWGLTFSYCHYSPISKFLKYGTLENFEYFFLFKKREMTW